MSRSKVLAVIGVSVAVAAVTLGAQTYSPPKTPWGHPDLQGIYSNDDETGTPMERPAQFAGKTLADITPAELDEDRQAAERTVQRGCRRHGIRRWSEAADPSHLRFLRAQEQPRLARRRSGRTAASRGGPTPLRDGGPAASARMPTRAARSTAGSTWASTIAASRAAFRTR